MPDTDAAAAQAFIAKWTGVAGLLATSPVPHSIHEITARFTSRGLWK